MQSFYFISLYLFLFAIIVIRLPNIYFLPFVTSGLFTTQAIARAIFIVLFIAGFFFYRQKSAISKNSIMVIILLLGFLITSSLSILWAQNLEAFFIRYKDLVIGILSFFVFKTFASEKKKIVIALLIPIPINILYQSLLIYGKNVFFILENLVYQKHFDLVSYNLHRGRIYMDVYDEAFLPLIVLILQTKKKLNIFLAVVSLFFISAFAFLSNFRTRILMLMIGLISSFVILQKVTIKKIGYFFVFIIFVGFIVSFLSSFKWGYSFYDRFLFSNIRTDIQTVFSRYEQIGNALDMGFVSPFGVGLGNYYDILITQRGAYYAYITSDSKSTAYQNIHNNFAIIIAESGYITFIFYFLLMAKFAAMDYKTLGGKDMYKKSFVISFWMLFFFGLFNPPIPGSYQILFWGIRGLLG